VQINVENLEILIPLNANPKDKGGNPTAINTKWH
jgi:hypothetical protein